MVYSEAELFEKISQIISDLPICFFNKSDILSSQRLREDIGLDSLAMVDLIVELEDQYSIFFNPVTMDLEAAFETVDSLVKFMKMQLDGIE